MKIETSNSDDAVLAEMGRRLARTRLEGDLSQEQLSERAGVSKATVERLEAGSPVKSTSLIRVLRSLGRLDALDRLVPEPPPSPLQRLRTGGRQRRRASGSRGPGQEQDSSSGGWAWADDEGGGGSG